MLLASSRFCWAAVMNFRRGPLFFLLPFCAEDIELCFQKTHKLIHNLANGVAALSVESEGQSLLRFPRMVFTSVGIF